MKKLIAISVMLALVAGAAFAETSVGAYMELNWTVAKGQTVGGVTTDANMASGITESKFDFSASSDDGRVSGFLRYTNLSTGHGGSGYFITLAPIDQIKLYFGYHPDGLFNPTGPSRWGYHAGSHAVAASGPFWDAADYFAVNWDKWTLSTTIKPIDLIAINLGLWLPGDFMGHGGASQTNNMKIDENLFKGIFAQVVVSPDFGSIALSYKGETVGNMIGLHFISGSIVDGLTLEAGGSYKLTSGATDAIKIALAAAFSGGDWGVKARFFVDGFDNIKFKAGLLPYYNFGALEARLDFEVEIPPSPADPTIRIAPYVVVPIDNLTLLAGFNFTSTGSNNTWSVPLTFKFSF